MTAKPVLITIPNTFLDSSMHKTTILSFITINLPFNDITEFKDVYFRVVLVSAQSYSNNKDLNIFYTLK